jgi:hypothetical protein
VLSVEVILGQSQFERSSLLTVLDQAIEDYFCAQQNKGLPKPFRNISGWDTSQFGV